MLQLVLNLVSQDDILDPHTNPGAGAMPPSETVQPTVVEDAPQQGAFSPCVTRRQGADPELGATQPGSGSTVTESEAHKPRFKEQVIGEALASRSSGIGLAIWQATPRKFEERPLERFV